ncbi:MAG TPA: methyltransferase domain-containing protein [Burkholderiales bacterium]|nr:methyltransferase domain-containing protein [Burkholderiales bacterium]
MFPHPGCIQRLDNEHALQSPSEWVQRWACLIAADGEVLDLACGSGRHSRYLASAGYHVCAVDRDAHALAALTGVTGVSVQVADLERAPWPLEGRRFAGIVVCNYLYRPLFPHVLDALERDGALIYETFALGNERFGKPSNPDFLLRPGELLELVRGKLRVLAYEDLQVSLPKPAMVQRICAVGAAWNAPAAQRIG